VIVVMNVVRAAPGRAADFERAFLERERLLHLAEGFRGFELLRRDRGDEYVVLTRWESAEAFRAWVKSDLFRRSHRRREGDLATVSELRTYEVLDVEVPDAEVTA
jgi:heme-degrading monooxygenase HmoA